MSEHAEGEFVSRLKQGEKQAFRALVDDNAGWMLQLAKQYTQSDATAADCVQETFLQIYRKISEFEGRSSLRTWMRSILVNQALMKLRKIAQDKEQEWKQSEPKFDRNGFLIGPISIANNHAEDLIVQREVSSIVRDAINGLPDKFRAVLLLRDIEGYSTQKTAQALEISESAVRTRLHRARMELKNCLLPTMGPKSLDDIL